MTRKVLEMLLVVVFAFPFVMLLLLAITKTASYPHILGKISLGALSFARGNQLWVSGLLTLFIALSVAFLSTPGGLIVSRAIYRSPYRLWLLVSAYLPFLISPVIYAVVLSYFFLAGGLSGTILGVFLGHLLIAFPFATLLSISFWNTHTDHLIQVSQTLGAGQLYIWKEVIFPMARPQLYVVFFQSFLVSWFEYGLTQYIGVGKVSVLTISVFGFVQEADISLAAAASLLLVLPPLLLLWLNKKYIYPKILANDA